MRPIILRLLILMSLLLPACAPAAVPTATPAPPTQIPPTPTSTTVPTPEPSYVSICKTDGIGAYIRAEPKGSGIVAWPDGVRLKLAGPDRSVDGEVWRNVQDEKGNTGWTMTDYLCPD